MKEKKINDRKKQNSPEYANALCTLIMKIRPYLHCLQIAQK